MRTVINSSGTYQIDDSGVLCGFQSAESNRREGAFFYDDTHRGCAGALCRVEIPEGVKALRPGVLQGYTILFDIVLPESLHVLSEGALTACGIPNLGALKGIREIGYGAFANSHLQSITLRSDLCCTGNPFPGALIDSLAFAAEYMELRAAEIEAAGGWIKQLLSTARKIYGQDRREQLFVLERNNTPERPCGLAQLASFLLVGSYQELPVEPNWVYPLDR